MERTKTPKGKPPTLTSNENRRLLTYSIYKKLMEQKDGIVHGDRKLQNGGGGGCDKGNLTKNQIGAQVQYDSDADGDQKQEGLNP